MYKLTGYHSDRHPFLGAADDLTFLAADPTTPTAPATTSKWLRPLVSGATSGLVSYAACRAFDVEQKKSLQVAFLMLGINVIFGFASDYLYSEVQALAAQQPQEARA